MNLFLSALEWVAVHFTPDLYLFTTKIQGILWSAADIALVFFLLKIAGLIRRSAGKRGIFYRYALLWASAILTPLLLFCHSGKQLFILESLICGTQFLVLVCTVVSERKMALEFFEEMTKRGKT